MDICTCSGLPETRNVLEGWRWCDRHYGEMGRMLDEISRQRVLPDPERRARLYQNRHAFSQAKAASMGACQACDEEAFRLVMDMDHLGNFRGVLCRGCLEKAKKIKHEDGQITWWVNSIWCQMVGMWAVDWCAMVEDHDESGEACARCVRFSDGWLAIGRYLARYEGLEWVEDRRWHLYDPPTPTPKGAEAVAPTPLFLAPG